MATKTLEIYENGQLVRTITYEVSASEIERDEAPPKLRAALRRLTAIATQCDAVAAQGTNVTQAQLKQLFAAVADEARALRALIIREFDEPES